MRGDTQSPYLASNTFIAQVVDAHCDLIVTKTKAGREDIWEAPSSLHRRLEEYQKLNNLPSGVDHCVGFRVRCCVLEDGTPSNWIITRE